MPPARKLYAASCPSRANGSTIATAASTSASSGVPRMYTAFITISATTFIQPGERRSSRHGLSPASGTSPSIATDIGNRPRTTVTRYSGTASRTRRHDRRSDTHPTIPANSAAWTNPSSLAASVDSGTGEGETSRPLSRTFGSTRIVWSGSSQARRRAAP